MDVASYKEHWNRRAKSPEDAVAAVDGSSSEEIVRHTGKWSAAQVSADLDVGSEDHILELGCGVGRIGRELAGSCRHWTGVDISDSMIDYAGERLKHLENVSFHRLERTSLEMIDDDSIDKAYSIAVFCHMDKEDLFIYLQELNRVVRPGGLIFVETWNLSHPVGWRRWEYEPLVWAQADQNVRKDIARNQFCTPEEFQLYVDGAGFSTLANFNDSQCVQIIAGNQMSGENKAAEIQRITKDSEQIAYSAMYCTLFGHFVDVIFGRMTAAQMLEFVDALGDIAEARLFRPYLLSLWEKNAELWGPSPG